MENMKNPIIFILLMAASSIAFAFQGTMQFINTKSGVEQTIQLSKWSVDSRGVPSFDYAYSQKTASCKYEMSGRAIAGFEEDGKKVDLEIYNPQDAQGNEMEQILAFHDDSVTLTLPVKEKNQGKLVTFEAALAADARRKSCVKNAENLTVVFKKTH
ncbi:hypothetical protein [Collimonas pratensis]|uniref:Uncharacterized protein n=1 Tax=Collimonas pratensis TaxID=279113 RepID=A0ABM5ZDW9_9BURK|nr:hypothetical protein [Collimonas pratensis]AMP17376.1 hypothetical protein CPter291_5163 [Collimonas pratensis]